MTTSDEQDEPRPDADAGAPETGNAPPAGEPGRDAAEAAAAALAEENADLKDRLLRAVAEMENLRKRTGREVRDAGQYAISTFARDMLVVADNLQRALDTVPPEDGEAAKIAFNSMREGVSLTRSELARLMERHGVSEIAADGEKFDPNLHQAMFEIPDTSVPNGTVMQVVQPGFRIGERVLRPAMVGVAQGGPKETAAPAQPAEAATPATPEPANDAEPPVNDGEPPADHIDKTV